MDESDLLKIIKDIVFESTELKNRYTEFKNAHVNYVCIFSQSDKEYEEFKSLASKIGEIIEETYSGPLFKIPPVDTVSGKVQLLKVRQYDETKPERGDSDFTVKSFNKLKDKYLSRKGFELIEREDFEMVELIDSDFNVRVYFSNPPLDEQLGLN